MQSRVTACIWLTFSLLYSGRVSQPLFVVLWPWHFLRIQATYFIDNSSNLVMSSVSWWLHSRRFWGLFHEKSEIIDFSNGFPSYLEWNVHTLPNRTRSCFFTVGPWRALSLSLSASGPLYLLLPLPIICSPWSLLVLPPPLYSGTFTHKLSDNLRFQSTAFFHCLEPSLPARFLKAFLSLLSTPSMYVCVMLIHNLPFETNLCVSVIYGWSLYLEHD